MFPFSKHPLPHRNEALWLLVERRLQISRVSAELSPLTGPPIHYPADLVSAQTF